MGIIYKVELIDMMGYEDLKAERYFYNIGDANRYFAELKEKTIKSYGELFVPPEDAEDVFSCPIEPKKVVRFERIQYAYRCNHEVEEYDDAEDRILIREIEVK